MTKNNIEKMKEILASKKNKGINGDYLSPDKKIGSGRIEKQNQEKGNGPSRTKKICQ
jgi:hypothetical protein